MQQIGEYGSRPMAAWLRESAWLAIVAVLFLIAFALQSRLVLNADLGWLLTLDEKFLAGARFGVDVFESNPPLSALMYAPSILIGRVLGVAPEFVVVALVLAEIAAVLGLLRQIPFVADRGASGGNAVACWFALLLAVIPGPVFAQREHIAVVALLPSVAVAAARWRGVEVARRIALLAGLLAGLAICIKPYFAAVIVMPMLLTALLRRSLRPLLGLEMFCIAMVYAAYAGTVVIFFPAYISLYVPMVAAAYVPVRNTLPSLLPVPFLAIGSTIAAIALGCRWRSGAWRDGAPWLAAACGGVASYLIQGKGWAYTTMALWACALAAIVVALQSAERRLAATLFAAVVFGVAALLLQMPPPGFPELAPEIQRFVQKPRMLTITDHIGLGHPLVRQVGGMWAGSSCAQLLSGSAMFQLMAGGVTPSRQKTLEAVIAFERRHLAADIRNARPDIVLVDSLMFSSIPFDWLAWAKADKDVQAALRNYKEVEEIGRVRILMRDRF